MIITTPHTSNVLSSGRTSAQVDATRPTARMNRPGFAPPRDHVTFRGRQENKPGWKKYMWPGLEIVTGSGIALSGLPLHLIPGFGNVIATGLHLIGGLLALHGVYKAYKAYKGEGGENAAPPVNSNVRTVVVSDGGGSMAGNLVANAAGGAAAGLAAELVHEGVERFKNHHSEQHSPHAHSDDAHHHHNKDHSSAGDVDSGDVDSSDFDSGDFDFGD